MLAHPPSRQLLGEMFTHYCHKHIPRPASKLKLHGQTSPRIKNDNALGAAKLSGASGAERAPRFAKPTLSFEGGKAFATDVGLVGDILGLILRGWALSKTITTRTPISIMATVLSDRSRSKTLDTENVLLSCCSARLLVL